MLCGMFIKNVVPINVSNNPRYRYCVPIVTINEGAFSRCTSTPLITPSTTPPTAPTIRISANGASGHHANTALVIAYIVNAPIAVNDTSMPPDASTTSVPSANSDIVVAECNRSNSVASWKKRGLIAPTIAHITTISATVNHSGLRESFARHVGGFTSGAISTTLGVVTVRFIIDDISCSL